MNNWIDVNDRVPIPNDIYDNRHYPVIVVDEQGHRFVSTARMPSSTLGYGYSWFPDSIRLGKHRSSLTVTHWQPLPELPGEEN